MHSHILISLVCSEVIALAIHTKSDSCLKENLRCPKFLYRNYRPSPVQAKDVFSVLALLIFTHCGVFLYVIRLHFYCFSCLTLDPKSFSHVTGVTELCTEMTVFYLYLQFP